MAVELQLTSEPKSGSTWMEYVLIRLCQRACASSGACTCRWRRRRRQGSDKVGHRLLEWLGLQQRGADLRRSYLLAQRVGSSGAMAHDTVISQALHSKHSVPAATSYRGSRFPEGTDACARSMNVSCLRSLALPVMPWEVHDPAYVRPLLLVRDPRHLVLSECAWRLQVSYSSCMRDRLRTRARNVGNRFALHAALFEPGLLGENHSDTSSTTSALRKEGGTSGSDAKIRRNFGLTLFYDDLINSFQRELRRLCTFAGFPEQTCRNTSMLSMLEQETSKESMRKLEQSSSGNIPGPNRASISQKVSSAKPVGKLVVEVRSMCLMHAVLTGVSTERCFAVAQTVLPRCLGICSDTRRACCGRSCRSSCKTGLQSTERWNATAARENSPCGRLDERRKAPSALSAPAGGAEGG